jgi:hypothetical protein
MQRAGEVDEELVVRVGGEGEVDEEGDVLLVPVVDRRGHAELLHRG